MGASSTLCKRVSQHRWVIQLARDWLRFNLQSLKTRMHVNKRILRISVRVCPNFGHSSSRKIHRSVKGIYVSNMDRQIMPPRTVWVVISLQSSLLKIKTDTQGR